jgi:hypothetical protein
LSEVAKEYKGKALFVYIDGDEPSHQNVMDYFGFKKDSLPIYLIFEVKVPPTRTLKNKNKSQ